MNYSAVSRTNFFAVEDESKLRKMISYLPKSTLIEKKDELGTKFAFTVVGVVDDFYHEKEDRTYDISEYLQDIVAQGEVIIIIEAGNAGAYDVRGEAGIITKQDLRWISFIDLIKENIIDVTKVIKKIEF